MPRAQLRGDHEPDDRRLEQLRVVDAREHLWKVDWSGQRHELLGHAFARHRPQPRPAPPHMMTGTMRVIGRLLEPIDGDFWAHRAPTSRNPHGRVYMRYWRDDANSELVSA